MLFYSILFLDTQKEMNEAFLFYLPEEFDSSLRVEIKYRPILRWKDVVYLHFGSVFQLSAYTSGLSSGL